MATINSQDFQDSALKDDQLLRVAKLNALAKSPPEDAFDEFGKPTQNFINKVLSLVTFTGSTEPMFTTSVGLPPVQIQTNISGLLINLDAFRADPRFSGIDGSNFAVGILDTGIKLDHPFFGPDSDSNGIADRIIYQYDFADGDANATDNDGHGSNVTSIATSSDGTYTGMASNASIMSFKVFTDAGVGEWSYLESALGQVATLAGTFNIAAINMSLGDSGNYNTEQALYDISDEIAALRALGVITVSSAGNSFFPFGSAQGVAYPAADANSLAVSAVWDADHGPIGWVDGSIDNTTGADRIVSFSQRSATLTDIFAPGAFIVGADAFSNGPNADPGFGGTSQAAPHIAGIAALSQQLAMQVIGRRLTQTEFVDLLRTSAVIINDGDDEDDNVTNTGLDFPRVDMLALGNAIYALASDLTITKDDGVDSVVAGGTTTYTIVANNPGTADITDATIADPFPTGITGISWTAEGSVGTDGFEASGSDATDPIEILDTGITIPNGGSLTYTITATIDPAATGTIDNIVSLESSLTDPDLDNNSATDSNTVLIEPDLSITKDDGVTSVVAGAATTYTIVASNAGLSDAAGATITDTFPAELGTPSWTSTAGGGATGNTDGSGDISDTVTMPAGSSITYTVVATIDPSATGSVTNTALITAPAGVTDPDTGNNSADDINTIGASADLSITKSDGIDSVMAGSPTTYTIVASNAGLSDAAGATITDTFPAELGTPSWTSSTGGAIGVEPSGTGNISDTVTLPAGSSITYTVIATVAPNAADGTIITNTAIISPPSGVNDPNLGNNTGPDTTTVNALPDLTITKTDTPDPVLTGGTLNYTLTVKNDGGKAATGIVVKDTLPSGFTFDSTSVTNGFTANESGGIVTFSNGSLTAGQSATLTITGTAPETAGLITNTAVVDPDNTIAESNENNNTASTNTTVTTPTPPGPPGIPGIPGTPGTPPPGGTPTFPIFPPPFVPPALTPTIEPPPGGALPPIYLSTTTSNNFRGTEAPEFIYGGPFDDTIDGAGGNDTILGREGRDLLIGGNGSDKLFGNQGDDRLYGGDGDDTVYGGKDNDFINGERGHDFLRGDLGDDTVRGGDGDDTLYGGKGNDSLLGDRGDDYLSGDLGNDTLDGVGRDRESVGEIDTLVGGEGANLFVLGTTNTVYYNNIGPGAGYGDYALIEDFNASQDRLQLKGGVNYILNFSPNGLPGGTGIYVDDGPNVGTWDEEDELIAVLKDIAPNDSLFSRMNFV